MPARKRFKHCSTESREVDLPGRGPGLHDEPVPEQDHVSPAAPSDDDADCGGPLLTVAAAARRLGVAPATLRTWDRRYGIGPSEHVPGRHRRYSPADLARLERMRHALVRGASPADAARYALTAPVVEAPAPSSAPSPVTEATFPTATAPAAPPAALPGAQQPFRSRTGGGALRLSGAGSAVRGLGRAALALDATAVTELLAEALAAEGAEATWDGLVRPVLAAVGQHWAHTGAGVEVEHLVSECVVAVFGAHRRAAAPAGDTRPVLIAAMPGEVHTLPIVALATTLAHRRVAHRYLGADLPVDALLAAVRRTAPVAVVLWAQAGDTADAGVLDALPQIRPGPRTFAAGPGWADAAVPDRTERLHSLGQAVASIGAVLA